MTDAAVRGRYAPLARLATGGMAEILLARLEGAQGFEKLVVLKRLLPHLAEEARHVAMFLDEARTVARISHPNVCQVYELGEEAGRYTIVMEYLEGVTLGRVTLALPPRRGVFELRLCAELFRQACEGLHHAHELHALDGTPAGLVHRDISPQNLLVTLDGVLKVLDFGIAKTSWSTTRTRAGMVLGKTTYMSPEQVRGQKLDRKSDLFALGIVLHEMLVGQSLWKRENDFLSYKAITEDDAPDVREHQPDVPAALAQVVRATLSRPRAGRPATARELGERIVAAVAPLGGPLRASEVAEWMAVHFGGELRERRDLVVAAVQRRAHAARLSSYGNEDLPTVPTDVAEVPAPALAETRRELVRDREMPGDGDTVRDNAAPARPAAAPASAEGSRPDTAKVAPPRRPKRGAWLVLASLAALAMLPIAWCRGAPARPRAPVARPAALVVAGQEPIELRPDAALAPPSEPLVDALPPDEAAVPLRPLRPLRDRSLGWFTVDSKPYAIIFVDGRRVGFTPVVRLSLPAGAHQVRAVTTDGREQRLRVVIEAGHEAPRRRLVW